MPWCKKEEFLQEVLSHIKFSFDRDDIKSELDSHIIEKTDCYIEEGYDLETAEQMSIRDMGDPKEIGVELNKEHNPVIGWIWRITNGILILFLVFNIFVIGVPFIFSLFTSNSINRIPKSDIVYRIDVNEKVKIDDRVIHFKSVIYEKNGNMHIFYEDYDTRLWGRGWSLGTIGKISDNLGNEYFGGSGGSSGGIKSKSVRRLRNFSPEADTLIISYDYYNRQYRVEIPLQAGDDNE